MSQSGIYSHPNVLLEEHINNVLSIYRKLKNDLLPFWDNKTLTTLEVAIVLHDIGKATEYFQRKLRGEKISSKERKYSQHSLFSAVYTFYKLHKEFFKNFEYPLLGYFLVANHHAGVLKSFKELLELTEDDIETFLVQLNSINPERVNLFIENLNLPRGWKEKLKLQREEFETFLREELLDLFDDLSWDLEDYIKPSLERYITLLYLFSLLVDADKTEAGAKGVPSFLGRRIDIPPSLVEEYVKTLKGNSPINRLRQKAFEEVKTFGVDTKEHFYTLTLPTGYGKTLIGLLFALKLKREIERETQRGVRLIYALPFLSIIDQNTRVVEEVLKPLGKRVVVKHHHLSLGEYLKQREEDYELTRILVEAWNAPVVITTFVQLFHTLLAYSNSNARRLNKLSNAVVLVDEVQALPPKYWYLFEKYLKEVAKNLNTYFVFMTATQPYLVEGREVIRNRETYFNSVNRYGVSLNLDETPFGEFLESLKPEEGTLYILNTIRSSQEVYRYLTEELGVPREEVAYLSASLTPNDRRRRLIDLKKGKYRFAVSTQVVEAGVDIDFPRVVRDFAPLDALIQSAGRCNRNFTFEKGTLEVVNLIDENDRRFAFYIYDPILLKTTLELLLKEKPKDERELTRLVEKYFDLLKELKSKDTSKELLEKIENLNFKDIPCRKEQKKTKGFCFIEDEPYKADVFVQTDQRAVEIWNTAKGIIRKLREKKLTLFEAKREFEKLKGDFYGYVISLRVDKNKPPFDEELNTYYVPIEELENYYDPEIGFIEKIAG